MPTKKKRLNVTLSAEMEKVLAVLAERDNVPVATKAALLLETAVQVEEDEIWDLIAGKRDVREARYLSHEKAWA